VSPEEIESLERATVAAVAPLEVVEIGGWLVPPREHPMGRGRCAVPLHHDLGPAALDEIEAAYRVRSLPPRFRIAEVDSLEPLRRALAARGYQPHQPTAIEVGDIARLAAFADGPVRLLERPDTDWTAVFTGDGFDPKEGGERVAFLSRSPGAIFAAAGEGATQAVGVASFGHGWAGIHGMRTTPAARGKGLAAQILGALGREIQAREMLGVALQVEEANPARRIYRRAGFEPVWTYRYWTREAA
jgi:N-acetylglutamate synthase